MKAAVRTTARQKLLLAAFGLALAGLGVLVVEGALSLLGLGESYLYRDPFVGFEPGNDLFTLQDGVYVTSPNKLAFFNHQEFPAAKAPDAYRVFALGGSTTAGRPYDDKVAFARWLELYLGEMDASRRFEVVNAGAISYASYRIVVLMKELVRYAPDLFVIYTGHNEFLEERTYSDLIHEEAWRRRLRLWLGGLRSVTLAREGLRRLEGAEETPKTLLASEVRSKLASWTGLDAYHRDDELAGSVVEHFAFNLRQMVRIARDHGADVVFVRPVSNLKDFSPFKSEPEPTEEIAALATAGRAALDTGDAEGALEIFGRLTRDAPDYADHHFRLGRAHFLRREYDEARRAFVRARELDVAPLRALGAIEELVAEVAGETGAPLVDLPAMLEDDCEARYGHRLLGNEYLQDHVHPDLSVHSLIAERLIDVLVARGEARPDPSWSEEARRAVYDRLVGAIDRRYYAVRDLNLAKVLGWAGKLEEAEAPLVRAAQTLTDEPDVHLNLGILYQKTERPEEALRELTRAVELAPGSPEAHFNLGVTQGLLGRPQEGIEALEEALRLRPDYGEARHNLDVLHRRQDAVALTDLGITHGRQGDLEAALTELERAVASDPDFAEAHYNLGIVQARRGRADEAVAAYREALEVDPLHAPARNNLGILHAGRGDLESARRELEQAVADDPGYAEAHFNLGVVLDQSGRPGEAIAAVERALELDPENARFRQAMAMLLQARADPD